MPSPDHGKPARRLTVDELTALVRWIARGYLEVQSGQRPMSALRGLLSGELYLRLDRDMPRADRPEVTDTHIGAAIVHRVGYERVYGVAVVEERSKMRAFLVQLEQTRSGKWQVVDLGILRPEPSQFIRPKAEAERP